MTAAIDAKEFRKALGSFTTGVTIVTTQGEDGRDCGLTANSFNSVSMDPPMVLWSLGKTSSSLPAFTGSSHFAVHILSANQEAVSNHFSKSGKDGLDKFADIEVTRGHGNVPLLDGCSARFECRVVHQYEGGDHVIFVGEVLNFDSFARPPLAFHGGKYGVVMKKSAAIAADAAGAAGPGFGDSWLGFMLARAYYQLLLPIRDNLNQRGLHDIDYSVLTVLSMGDGRSIDELARLVAITGVNVNEGDILKLVERGLVTVDDTGSTPRQVHFTEAGRKYAIELLALAKAVESDAEGDLDYSEAQAMKLLLQRVIRSSETHLPDHWRKEHFWRGDNLWQDTGLAAPNAKA